jgi:hypothetical protein
VPKYVRVTSKTIPQVCNDTVPTVLVLYNDTMPTVLHKAAHRFRGLLQLTKLIFSLYLYCMFRSQTPLTHSHSLHVSVLSQYRHVIYPSFYHKLLKVRLTVVTVQISVQLSANIKT